MQDEAIVEMFWERDESALNEAQTKYQNYISKIAVNILADIEDAREIVNETLFKAWNSIPPQRPSMLKTYLGKLARELSIDLYRSRHRKKRVASEFTVSIDELGDIISDSGDSDLDSKALGETIDRYLHTLSDESRIAFVQRYYFADTVREIAKRQGVSESTVKSRLLRARRGLKEYLEKEGYTL